jgi:hypothetical protein
VSVSALAWAFDAVVPNAGAKLTLLAVANFAGQDGSGWASQPTLARLSSQGERTVRRHLATLEAEGRIRLYPRVTADGTRLPDGFELPLAEPAGVFPPERRTGQTGRMQGEPDTEDGTGQTGRRPVSTEPPAKLAGNPVVDPVLPTSHLSRDEGASEGEADGEGAPLYGPAFALSEAQRIVVACNTGQKDNPRVAFARPIPLGHGSLQTVLDWLHGGIEAEFAEGVVRRVAREYAPRRPKDQIGTMNYFDGAVRDAWETELAERAARATTGEREHGSRGTGTDGGGSDRGRSLAEGGRGTPAVQVRPRFGRNVIRRGDADPSA